MGTDPKPLTLAEFLAWEERQPSKYEYRDGAVSAMAGASDDHGQIVANVIAIIRPALRGTACRVYPSDMKVVTTFPVSRYPDIVVTCDQRDANDRMIKRHPKLLVEVLSAATARIDTSDKLDEYRTIPELEEYVLIDSRKPCVWMYRRNVDRLEATNPAFSGSIELRSLGITLALTDIYEDVGFGLSRNGA